MTVHEPTTNTASTVNPQTPDGAGSTASESANPSAPELSATERQEAAQSLVNKYALGAAGLGLLPFPVIDMVTLSGAQIKMIHDIGHLYGFPMEGKPRLLSVIGSLTASVGIPTLILSTLLSGAKAIPGIGSLISVTVVPATFGALTYGVGRVFIQHFESGGTYLTLDPARMRDAMKEFYQEALHRFKKEHENQDKGTPAPEATPPSSGASA